MKLCVDRRGEAQIGSDLLHFKNEAFQVFGFGQVEHYGMIERGAAAFEQSYATSGVNSGRGYRAFEIGPADVVGAGASDQQPAWDKHLEGAQVEFLVTAQGAFDGALGLGESGRVENDGVEFLAGVGPVAEDLKGVGFNPIDLGGDEISVGFEIALGDFERGTRCIDAGDVGANLCKVKGKAALIAADVEGAGCCAEAARPVCRGGVVGALIEEGTGLLSGVGVVVEDEAVEAELAAGGWMGRVGRKEWFGTGRVEALQFAHAGIGAFEDGRGRKFIAQDADAHFAHSGGVETAGEQLEQDERAVLVYDEAG